MSALQNAYNSLSGIKEWSSGLKLDDVLQLNAVKRYKEIAEMDNRKVNGCLNLRRNTMSFLLCFSLNHKFLIPVLWIVVVTESQQQLQNISHCLHVSV